MFNNDVYMRRAIQLAKNGLGTSAPNPMVGAVIVHENKIIGEGFTSPYGGPHAEVNAISSVKDKTELKYCTLFVTLEPCSHYGKTPPCADLILKHNIPKVVIGTLDPHSKVAGKGKQLLEEAGRTVIVGVLENECKEHHKRFLTFHQKKRPFIILKWAETLDGFIAPDDELRATKAPYWITNKNARQVVHKWRCEEQAILVGTTTVLKDNPKLNARSWKGNSPIRIILDKELVIDTSYNVFDGHQRTIIVTHTSNELPLNDTITYESIDFEGDVITQLCIILYKQHITSIIIEGGTKTIQAFIDQGIWDEARVFIGNNSFNKGLKAPVLSNAPKNTTQLGSDKLNTYRND